MAIEDNKSLPDQQPRLGLTELLNIASGGYTDDFLKEYYDSKTGQFNHQGSGDTLAAFIVREIIETYDPALGKAEQLSEVCRVLRAAIRDLESVIAAAENA